MSSRSDPFELHLPPDWRNRARRSGDFSTPLVSVLTPCPEDLASMKVFRLHAKDAEDIRALAATPGFDRSGFRKAFEMTLPFAIGRRTWHEQSFRMVWEALYPDVPLDESDSE
jgi:hypothetical protein